MEQKVDAINFRVFGMLQTTLCGNQSDWCHNIHLTLSSLTHSSATHTPVSVFCSSSSLSLSTVPGFKCGKFELKTCRPPPSLSGKGGAVREVRRRDREWWVRGWVAEGAMNMDSSVLFSMGTFKLFPLFYRHIQLSCIEPLSMTTTLLFILPLPMARSRWLFIFIFIFTCGVWKFMSLSSHFSGCKLQVLSRLLDGSANPDVLNRQKQVAFCFYSWFWMWHLLSFLFCLTDLISLHLNDSDPAYVGSNARKNRLCGEASWSWG